jgi:hypothetical protein
MEIFVNISGEKKLHRSKTQSLTLGRNVKKCSAEEDNLT